MEYYNIYNVKQAIKLEKELGYIMVGNIDDDSYFDGYADVYDVLFTYKNDEGNYADYAATVTHEVLCYFANGID